MPIRRAILLEHIVCLNLLNGRTLIQILLEYISSIDDIITLRCLSSSFNSVILSNVKNIRMNSDVSAVRFDLLRKIYMKQLSLNRNYFDSCEPQCRITVDKFNVFLCMKLKVCNVILLGKDKHCIDLINRYLTTPDTTRKPQKFKFYFNNRYIIYNDGLVKTDVPDISVFIGLDALPIRGIYIQYSVSDDMYRNYITLIQKGATGIIGTCRATADLLDRIQLNMPLEYAKIRSLYFIDQSSKFFTNRYNLITDIRVDRTSSEITKIADFFPNLDTLHVKGKTKRHVRFSKKWNKSRLVYF